VRRAHPKELLLQLSVGPCLARSRKLPCRTRGAPNNGVRQRTDMRQFVAREHYGAPALAKAPNPATDQLNIEGVEPSERLVCD